MQIVIVEDNLAQRRLLRAILTNAGYDVLEADDGLVAWHMIQQHAANLVITDWMMPGLDGLDLIHRIRSAQLPQYVYVLLLTARDSRTDVVTGLQAGADDYLTKPVNPDELLARVAVGERVLALETHLRTARDELRLQATHDHLTGLLNRRAFYEDAAVAFEQAQRLSLPLSVLLLDVDHFKLVNDQYGHSVGDQALQLLARTLEKAKRATDQVARWGGEEFAMLLPNTSLEDARIVAERIRLYISQSRLPLTDDTALSLRVSIGLTSTSTQSNTSLDDLLRQADGALYRAKDEGRNRVCVATGQHPLPPPTARTVRATSLDQPGKRLSEPAVLPSLPLAPPAPPAAPFPSPPASNPLLDIAILDSISIPVLVVDRSGHLVRFNRICEHVTGYTRTEVHGQPLADWFLTPGDGATWHTLLDALFAGAGQRTTTQVWTTRKGSQLAITWSYAVLPDAMGMPAYVVSTAIDVVPSLSPDSSPSPGVSNEAALRPAAAPDPPAAPGPANPY